MKVSFLSSAFFRNMGIWPAKNIYIAKQTVLITFILLGKMEYKIIAMCNVFVLIVLQHLNSGLLCLEKVWMKIQN